MKITILLSMMLSFMMTVQTTYAQKEKKKVETKTFEVSGVCDMCEKRIENAALIKGVKYAEWNKEAQKLKVIYKTKLTNEKAIHKAVAEAGHDTEKVKATDESYEKLPACCAYRDGVEIH
ncbi:MAG: heavy-metal-associated domain-containing protein [Bacteroidota bacterium]